MYLKQIKKKNRKSQQKVLESRRSKEEPNKCQRLKNKLNGQNSKFRQEQNGKD